MKTRFRKRHLAALAALVAIAVFTIFIARHRLALAAGEFLLRPETRASADVILVLGGEPNRRLPLALELYRQGLGREIWCPTTKTSKADREFERKFGFSASEETVVRMALKNSGLPDSVCRVLPGSTSTWTDMEMAKAELDRHPAKQVLVVSYPYHFRRIEFVIGKLFPEEERPEFLFGFQSPESWRNDLGDPDDVPVLILQEYVKLIGYWMKYR